MVGLDVTRQTRLGEEYIQRLETANTPAARAAARLGRSALERFRARGYAQGMPMHDPLAMAAFLDPSVVTLKKYLIEIETTGTFTSGETVAWTDGPVWVSAPAAGAPNGSHVRPGTWKPNVEVAVAVDPPKFFRLLIGRLTGQEPAF
jgi:inosine-uridine nucleoside N-ribohydrolase